MKNKANDPVDDINEQEYQKSLEASKKAETDKKTESATPKAAKSNLAVREEGWTDGSGNYIVSQNGVLTESQEAQIKDGKWKKYKKLSDGSYQF